MEFSKAEHERGVSLAEAALAGARLRLRPILMTALAFILGVVPLYVATGAGAASRRVLGTTVFGGMLAASFIAIFIIPTTFYVSQRLLAGASPPHPRRGAPTDAMDHAGTRRRAQSRGAPATPGRPERLGGLGGHFGPPIN